jgi:hypothetical protein
VHTPDWSSSPQEPVGNLQYILALGGKQSATVVHVAPTLEDAGSLMKLRSPMDSAEVVVETKAATITTRALFVKVERIIMVVWCCTAAVFMRGAVSLPYATLGGLHTTFCFMSLGDLASSSRDSHHLPLSRESLYGPPQRIFSLAEKRKSCCHHDDHSRSP